MSFSPFYIDTFGEFIKHKCELPFDRQTESPLAPFKISDPFRLRKAVVPVFHRYPDGRIEGMGTAFHVDGWGGFLTADHVIAAIRGSDLTPRLSASINIMKEPHAVLLLGIGLIYGQLTIPTWALAPITGFLTAVYEKEDPLEFIKGNKSFQIATDISFMQALLSPDGNPPHSLPVRLNGWQPTIGENVLAVGYSGLKPNNEVDDNELRALVEDEMYGAYGRITKVFPIGRESSNLTPGFEVEADWRPGMSGGPVFNQRGEVIGIVSRSLAPDGELAGVGYAASLDRLSTNGLISTLDPSSPGCRLGFAALQRDPWHLAGVFKTEKEAVQFATSLGENYKVTPGSHAMGSDGFCIHHNKS
ncbi:S1 family peptidase [Glaciimonas sp. GNP009]